MNLFQLNLFVNTIHSGSMKATADSFYISQSALSQNIKKLESELGCTLIDRTHSPLTPTTYGRIVLDRAERMLFLANEIEEEIARRKRIDAQTVKVGCFYPQLAYSEMAYVANAHPTLNFQVFIDSELEIIEDLKNGKYDLAFLPQAPSIPGFESFEFTKEQLFVSIPNNHELAKQQAVRCDQLRELKLTVPIELDGVSSWYNTLLDDVGADWNNIEELSSEDYFSAMTDPNAVHFRSSLMTAPLAMLSAKRHLPLIEPEVWRSIMVVYPSAESDNLETLLATLRHESQAASAISIIPKLLQFSTSSNLKITECTHEDEQVEIEKVD